MEPNTCKVGQKDNAQFYHVFMQVTGISPGKYK